MTTLHKFKHIDCKQVIIILLVLIMFSVDALLLYGYIESLIHN